MKRFVSRGARSFSSDPLANLYVDKQLKHFTPGLLNTTPRVRQTLLVDFGSRDPQFREVVKESNRLLLEINGLDTKKYTSVFVQGAGTYALEAALGSIVPRKSPYKLLILANGQYGWRQEQIAQCLELNYETLNFEEDEILEPEKVYKHVAAHPEITHVSMVHHETMASLMNPVHDIADAVHQAAGSKKEVKVFVDAMSTYGCYPVDMEKHKIHYVATSPNKAIHGHAGIGAVVAELDTLNQTQGYGRSLCLDLYAQHAWFQKTGLYRFSPPTNLHRAFLEAMRELQEEGGIAARRAKYEQMHQTLTEGLKALGFKEFQDKEQCCLVVTMRSPKNPNFHFQALYDFLYSRGKAISPVELNIPGTFRVGTIGNLSLQDARDFIQDVKDALAHMGVTEPLYY